MLKSEFFCGLCIVFVCIDEWIELNCQLYNSAKVTHYCPFRTRVKFQLNVEGSSEPELVKLVPMGSCWTCPLDQLRIYGERQSTTFFFFLSLLSFEFVVMVKKRRSWVNHSKGLIGGGVNSVTLSCTLQAISATEPCWKQGELLSLLFPWFVLVVFALSCHSRRSVHGYKLMLEIGMTRMEAEILILSMWSRRPSQLCQTLKLGWCLNSMHVVQSHRITCLFGVHFLTISLAI